MNVLNISGSIKLNKSVVLPVILNGYKTWSLTYREERRLRMLENRVMRRHLGLGRIT